MKTIKRLLVLCLCCGMLLPVGALAEASDILFEESVALYDGAAPTQFRVTQSAEPAADFPDDPALQMEVTPPDAPSYTLLFPCLEGTESEYMVPFLNFMDRNGDSVLDVEALYAQGASNVSCTYFFYDPADQRLHYAAQLGILSNATYDADTNTILSRANDGVMRQDYTLFGFAGGQPVALGAAFMEVQETEQGFIIQIHVTSPDGAVLLDAETPFDGADSAVWNAQYKAMMEVLMDIGPDTQTVF